MEYSPQLITTLYSYAILFSTVWAISMWRIYKKAGQPGWATIVPFYNIIVWLRIISKPDLWIIFLFVPGLNILFIIWMTDLLAKRFERNVWFTVGLILLPFIFYPLLAFKDYKFIGNDDQESTFVNNFELRRDEILIWSLGISLINILNWAIWSNFVKEWWNYYYIITPASVLLVFAYFLVGISVSNKYRTISITLSICIMIIYCIRDLLPEIINRIEINKMF